MVLRRFLRILSLFNTIFTHFLLTVMIVLEVKLNTYFGQVQFWACAEYPFRILSQSNSQSDLSDLTLSMRRVTPLIADFQCWTRPEVQARGRGSWC